MILIPKHLRNIASINREKDENLTLDIKCPCGCNKFIIYKNILTKPILEKDVKNKIRKSWEWYDKVLDPLITNLYSAAYYNFPEEGYREIIVYDSRNMYTKFDKEKDKSRIIKCFKINDGEVPLDIKEINRLQPYDDTIIIKITCQDCNKEYILFDNRIHGNDVADFNNDELKEYDFREKVINKKKGHSYKIRVFIKNYWDFENLEINGNEGLSFDDYSDMFGYIKIQAIDDNEKKYIIYSEELG